MLGGGGEGGDRNAQYKPLYFNVDMLQDDTQWWQAYREGEENALAGLIPSPSFHSQVNITPHLKKFPFPFVYYRECR